MEHFFFGESLHAGGPYEVMYVDLGLKSRSSLNESMWSLHFVHKAVIESSFLHSRILGLLGSAGRKRKKEMVITTFNGAGVGFGFGVGCGFGVGWGFGGMPLNFLCFGVGGGCGVGVGLGWGFGTAYGSKYRSSRITFQGVDLDSKEKSSTSDFSKPTPEVKPQR